MSMDTDRLEGAFYEYMHRVGQVDGEWNKNVLGFYVPYFAQCHRVLDVGCGEGQFIELLRAEGVEAVGIDFDSQMVEVCRGKGLDVIQADIFDYLPHQEQQVDGIFSSNLIEHFSAHNAQRFAQLALQALSPGGVFLVATPNPTSLIVHLHEFWRDATHVRLYNRSLLEFLLHSAGFEEIDSGENPRTSWAPPPAMQQVPRLLAETSSRQDRVRWDLILPQVVEPTQAPKPVSDNIQVERERSFLRRLTFSLRRRLARFLAQTVLFEEFASLNRALSDRFAELAGFSVAIHQIERTLYETQSGLLVRPREIFVKGVRPPFNREGIE